MTTNPAASPRDPEAIDPALPAAAQRALAEAAERRRRMTRTVPPREIGGRDGPDPVRFGDWERNGIAVDF